MWRSVLRSFSYAGRGLRLGVRSHMNMRIHLAIAALVALVAVWAGVSAPEAVVLVLCVTIVLAAELFNSAIEVLVDLQVGEQFHVLAGHAKDLAAAAVLVTAGGAAVAGAIVLGKPVLQAVGSGNLDLAGAARLAGLATVSAASLGVIGRHGRARTGSKNPHPPRGNA
jgi:diacylglycerol kinase